MLTVPEYSIQKTDFEKQKKELKKFAEQPATSTELDKFSTGGQWSDFWSGGLLGVLSGHKVTGEEINSLVVELQNCFAEINERDRKVIKEFGQVYETFEALDKGYIQGIVIGVKSAEKASQEAKEAQKDIDDTIKALQITINKLKDFKDEIKRYSHLNDIDSLWKDVQSQGKMIAGFPAELAELSKRLTGRIDEILAFKTEIEKVKHLKDIDSMWENTKSLRDDISKLSEFIDEKIGNIESDISNLKEFIDGQKHAKDIDKIWEEVQKLRKSAEFYDAFIDDIRKIEHLRDVDDEWNFSHDLLKDIEDANVKVLAVKDKVQEYDYRMQIFEADNLQLRKNIKVSYIIAGGAVGLSVIQLILQLMGIL